MADICLAVTSHPVAGLNAEEVEKKAKGLIETLNECLTGTRGK